MLFYSKEFLFHFLPWVFLGFYLLHKWGKKEFLVGWLIAASLFFYGDYRREHLWLLLGLLGINYLLSFPVAEGRIRWLWSVIVLDLGVLAWFKYSVVLREWPLLSHWAAATLPLGISFYTFQMIAYQVDLYKRRAQPASPAEFAFFILFFPQLIAGPIVHYATIFPQLRSLKERKCCETLELGILFFVVGMTKKVLLADTFARFADKSFTHAAGRIPGFWEAWQGLLAYSLQIYFDFCAYSEMAIGLGLIFGLRLPINFYSPYKAVDFRDFWRRWHITLSAFLRDYLYIPLGGNRRGPNRTLFNVLLVMTLAGAWHGAGWTFVLWGMAHGALIAFNHWMARRGWTLYGWLKPMKILGTFLAVTLLWVLFRSPSLHAAGNYYRGLFSFNGSFPEITGDLSHWMVHWQEAVWLWIAVGLLIVWTLPNLKDTLGYHLHERKLMRPGLWHGVGVGVLLWMALKTLGSGAESTFIYFAF